jgi:exodeoxyribonuclease VII large subunit
MRVFSVAQVNGYIKKLLEGDMYLANIYVQGEISNFKLHSSGHIYFTLKDGEAAISCIMFRSYGYDLKFMPENGMNVIVGGYVSVFEKTGAYQLYATDIKPAGMGELYLAYEQLKSRLEASGVFDAKYKKPIPAYPRCVAVITSPTGAAVRDIINVVQRRNIGVELVVVPTLVQGESAEEDIVSAIKTVNAWGEADTIIVGRGGGSLEDLWAFNTEGVARAIFDSKIPVISAVGHETDFTIADFIADMRAPTPSAAAELAVPESRNLKADVTRLVNRLNNALDVKLRAAEVAVKLTERLNNAYRSKIGTSSVVDGVKKRLEAAINNKLRLYQNRLGAISTDRLYQRVERIIENDSILVESRISAMDRNMTHSLEKLNIRLKYNIDALKSSSPLNILSKGYSIAYGERGLLRSAKDVEKGERIKITLNDGDVAALVTDIYMKESDTVGKEEDL